MLYMKARAFMDLGHTVVVYTGNLDRSFFPDLNASLDIRTVRDANIDYRARGGILGKMASRIMGIIQESRVVAALNNAVNEEFDILDCQNDVSYRFGDRYKRFHPKTLVIWTMNNCPFYHSHKNNPLENLLSLLISAVTEWRVKKHSRSIDVVIVNDDEQKKVAMRALPEAKVSVLRIPVDFKSFYRPITEPAPGQISLLSVGSLSPARKFEDTIMAGKLLKIKGLAVKVYIICRDYWNDRKYKAKLLDLVAKEDLSDIVGFHFDGVTEQELKTIQEQSDIFVFPNHMRIWGMAAFEAMAAGLPLIVARTTSVAEVLEDGESAIFVNAGQPEEIAEAAQALITNPARYKSIAAAGQIFVRDHLNWPQYVRNILMFKNNA